MCPVFTQRLSDFIWYYYIMCKQHTEIEKYILKRFLICLEHAYEDLNGKRLLSPFLQRKSSLQNHQSRSTERNAHSCLAYRAPIKRPQYPNEYDTQDRTNIPTNPQMISSKPIGSTSPISK